MEGFDSPEYPGDACALATAAATGACFQVSNSYALKGLRVATSSSNHARQLRTKLRVEFLDPTVGCHTPARGREKAVAAPSRLLVDAQEEASCSMPLLQETLYMTSYDKLMSHTAGCLRFLLNDLGLQR